MSDRVGHSNTRATGIQTLALPHRRIVETRAEGKHLITQGEYLVPHAFFWTFSNLRHQLGKLAARHELMHVIFRGSPVLESVKHTCIRGDRVEGFIIDELEGLASIMLFLDAVGRPDLADAESAESILTSGAFAKNPLMGSVGSLLDLINKSVDALTDRTEMHNALLRGRDILDTLTHRSCYVFQSDGRIVSPSKYLGAISDKFKDVNPETIDVDALRDIASQVFEEKGWVEAQPRWTKSIFALDWAALMQNSFENDRRLATIALRNCLESMFWAPIYISYLFDTRTSLVRRAPLVLLNRQETKGDLFAPTTPLGFLAYESTSRLEAAADEMIMDSVAEERLILKELPKVVANHLRILAEDAKKQNPVMLSERAWKTIATRIPFSSLNDLSVGEFLKAFDALPFEGNVKQLVMEGMYFDQQSCNVVETRAKQVYDTLNEDERKQLFAEG
jgi:hypothetical protein